MNATGPPVKRKRESRPGGAANLKKLELRAAYRILENFQRPFAWLFWLIEQRKARIDVELERLAL
jgi:hypothetical protein